MSEQPPPLNAPQAATLGLGIQPGTGRDIFASIVIVFGPAGTISGLFVYQPGTTPALGNPPIASVTAASSDPYGNLIDPGITSILSGGTAGVANLLNGVLSLGSAGSLVAKVLADPNFATGGGLLLQSGPHVGHPNLFGRIEVFADSSGTGQVASSNISAWDPVAGYPTVELWHNFTGSANFTVDWARYRLTPRNEVEIDFHGTTTSTTGVIIGNLPTSPASYVPALTPRHYPLGYTGTITTTSPVRLFVSGTGAVSLAGTWTSGATIGATIAIPLD